MYTPAYFRNSDLPSLKKFIRGNAFGALITSVENRIEVSHIPFELEEDRDHIFLHGHLSRANSQWEDFDKAGKALAVFTGAHAYVSSSWYNHINAPTWNYIAVHVTGKIELLEEGELLASLKKLTNHYETNSAKPFTVESMPDEMLHKYLKGIAGFRITVEKIEGKWKMSQNRSEEDFQNIIRELENVNDINSKMVAAEMKKIKT
jgi:transcriptional regulator